VPEVKGAQHRVRFEGFELNLRSGELRRKGGRVVRLSGQPFRILALLLERPQEIVTREELRKTLWPNDTIVEFEHSISSAINRLRQALGDSAEQPHYIETLARQGYRWMVPVEQEPSSLNAPTVTLSTSAVSPENLIGRKVSHYRVLELIGAGGMGVVYRAEDIKLDRRVALKFLPEELAKDPVALGRFEREARSASSLDHTSICVIHEFGEHEGQPFIVMQLLEGQTLRERIAAGTGQGTAISIDELIGVAIQISEGLEAAHRKGIIHRDIKPANIFITTRGKAKILDFGLAKLYGTAHDGNSPSLIQEMKDVGSVELSTMPSSSAAALALSKTGQTMGTASYMSPEQVRCEELDARTDLFSLGLVLYEMATSQQAFAGPTAAMVHDAILHHTPTSARVLNPKIPAKLDAIIEKCLDKDRELRYQSAGDLRTDLELLGRDAEHAPTRHPVKKLKANALVGVAAALLVVVTIVVWRFYRTPTEALLPPMEVVPLSGVPPGNQHRAAFSPDGNQLVFDQEADDQFCINHQACGIYLTLVDGEKSLRLTNNSNDCCPRWAPDGREIAFSRGSREIDLISPLGGIERRLYAGQINGNFDWSPDGKILAISEGYPDKYKAQITTARIALLSIADSTTKALTAPLTQFRDLAPAFSPDGSTVAFLRSSVAFMDTDLFVVSTAGGQPKRLTFDGRVGDWQESPAWTQDGREIIFSSSRKGLPTLWRIPASGGTPRPVTGVGAHVCCPSISRKGHELIYQNRMVNHNIWRIKLQDQAHPQGPPSILISTNGSNLRPDFSADGKKIAFESDRSGYAEIWTCDSNGMNCGQLTSLRGMAGTPRWSPDGRHIVFEFHPGAHTEIYVVDLGGGPPHFIPTVSDADNLAPNWSRDGQWIYFASNGGDGFQLWKVPSHGGSPIQLTRNGGVYGIESADRRFLYYCKLLVPGIWKMPLSGGEGSRVLDEAGGFAWPAWALGRNGIYFLSRHAQPKEAIKYFELATGKKTTILSLDRPVRWGVTVSPDETSLIYEQEDLYQESLILMKNFR
jgi:serine/threonine protein kinase/Tol biopolymer transport system component